MCIRDSTKSEVSHAPVKIGTHTEEIMKSIGYEKKIEELLSKEIISKS